ncbi:NolL Fucose 4-O-acetylase and related acetyltransferases [Comamonadaceae bacterium]
MPSIKKSSNIDWIYIAKGIGIILVVIGHFWPDQTPGYWKMIHEYIYLFHMPLFFLLSGTLTKFHNETSFKEVKQKSIQLAIPLISITLTLLAIKYITSFKFSLENPVTPQTLLLTITNPAESFAPLIWYLHALILMYIILYISLKAVDPHILFIASLFIALYPIEPIGGLHRIFFNFPFFVFGYLLSHKYGYKSTKKNNPYLMNGIIGLILVFACQLLIRKFIDGENLLRATKIVSGFIGAMAVISICKGIRDKNFIAIHLKEIGIASMSIYLFHTIFMGAPRLIIEKYANNIYFEVAAGISILSGIVIPYLLHQFVITKNRFIFFAFNGKHLQTSTSTQLQT